MSEISPKIPVEYNALKEALRRGLANSASRYLWWPNLANVNTNGEIENYAELGVIGERLSTILKEELSNGTQAVKGKPKAEIITTCTHILQVLLKTKLLTPDEVPNFETILRVIVSTLKRPGVSLMVSSDLLCNRERYKRHYFSMMW